MTCLEIFTIKVSSPPRELHSYSLSSNQVQAASLLDLHAQSNIQKFLAHIPWEDTPDFPKPPERNKSLHKPFVKGQGYLPGVCGWALRNMFCFWSICLVILVVHHLKHGNERLLNGSPWARIMPIQANQWGIFNKGFNHWSESLPPKRTQKWYPPWN